jgi:hypothetical protein
MESSAAEATQWLSEGQLQESEIDQMIFFQDLRKTTVFALSVKIKTASF